MTLDAFDEPVIDFRCLLFVLGNMLDVVNATYHIFEFLDFLLGSCKSSESGSMRSSRFIWLLEMLSVTLSISSVTIVSLMYEE